MPLDPQSWDETRSCRDWIVLSKSDPDQRWGASAASEPIHHHTGHLRPAGKSAPVVLKLLWNLMVAGPSAKFGAGSSSVLLLRVGTCSSWVPALGLICAAKPSCKMHFLLLIFPYFQAGCMFLSPNDCRDEIHLLLPFNLQSITEESQ